MSYSSTGNPFSDDVNPYAPPQTESGVVGAARPVGAWRKGQKEMVFRIDWDLPAWCVKTSQPADCTLKKTLTYLHPLVYVTALISPIIFIIIALILQRKAAVVIPLSRSYRDLRFRRLLLGWSGFIGSLLLLIGSFVVTNDPQFTGGVALIGAALLLLVASLVWLTWAERLLRPTRIDLPYVWVRGVSPEYLDRLPEWPYA